MAHKALLIGLATALALPAIPAQAGFLYYVAENPGASDFSHLYAYDPGSATIVDRGVIHGRKYTTDLATDLQGELYGVAWSDAGANGTASLFAITPGDEYAAASWQLETVKSNKMARDVAATAFGPDGALYASSASGDLQKLVYDATQDRWNVVKTESMGVPSAGDLAFSSDGLTLYAAVTGGRLATIDYDVNSITFGQATIIGPTGYDDLSGLAMIDGALYGTTLTGGQYGQSSLIQIDPLTGAAAHVADLGAGVWGATAASGAVPEPIALGLLLASGMIVQFKRYRKLRVR